MGAAGVFPVHKNVFKINMSGRVGTTYTAIKDMETFSVAVDGTKEKWTPMDLAGWSRQAVTGKSLSISLKGKRNYGDAGNDFIANTLLATGQECETQLQWTLPNGATLVLDCIIDLKSPAGGDSTNIDALDFELLSDGLPVFTPAGVLSSLTFVTVAGLTVGTTTIATVDPVITGGDSYVVKVGAILSSISFANVLTVANGWNAYTLGDELVASAGQQIVLVEVDANMTALKGGTSIAVVM